MIGSHASPSFNPQASANSNSAAAIPPRPANWGYRTAWLIITVVAVLSFHGIAVDWSRIGNLPSQIVHYSILMLAHPDWSKFGEALHQTLLSVEMAWIGTVFGALIATPLSFLASRGYAPRE